MNPLMAPIHAENPRLIPRPSAPRQRHQRPIFFNVPFRLRRRNLRHQQPVLQRQAIAVVDSHNQRLIA